MASANRPQKSGVTTTFGDGTDEVKINSAKFAVNGAAPVKVTGWTAATGTATRTSFATGTVTLAALAQAVKALIDDLLSQGIINA